MIATFARRLDAHSSTIGRILRLTTLAPDIIQAILNGEEPDGLSLAKLTQSFPEDWAVQGAIFGFDQ